MRVLTYKIPIEYDGKKVLHYLKGSAGLSSRLIRNLKQNEIGILLNGIHIRTVDILHTNDVLTINIPEDKMSDNELTILPKSNVDKANSKVDKDFYSTVKSEFDLASYGVEILFEDEDLLVLNKPAMLAMHPSHNHQGDTLANLVSEYLKLFDKGSVFRAVGRLDKGTSGIVVCAKNSFAASKLQGNIEKTYYALPTGFYEGEGTVDAPIYRPDPMKTFRSVDARGDYAVTHYKALASSASVSLLSVSLDTGRTHQIRVHFAHLGTPLVGDTMYGETDPRISHQALHCARAVFAHPYTGERIEINAKIPKDMQRIIDEFY